MRLPSWEDLEAAFPDFPDEFIADILSCKYHGLPVGLRLSPYLSRSVIEVVLGKIFRWNLVTVSLDGVGADVAPSRN